MDQWINGTNGVLTSTTNFCSGKLLFLLSIVDRSTLFSDEFVKNRPKWGPTDFFLNFLHNFYCGKCSQKIWAVYLNFVNLQKVNNDPIGENSPNLATLSSSVWLSVYGKCVFLNE
jgi:hypothetical protein